MTNLEQTIEQNGLNDLSRIIEVLEHNMKVVPDDDKTLFALAVFAAIPLLKAQQWVSVEDRLPDEGQSVIACTSRSKRPVQWYECTVCLFAGGVFSLQGINSVKLWRAFEPPNTNAQGESK